MKKKEVEEKKLSVIKLFKRKCEETTEDSKIVLDATEISLEDDLLGKKYCQQIY